MIQITRRLAREIRTIVKKTFQPRCSLVLTFRTGADGLFVDAAHGDQALRFHDPIPQEPHTLAIPLQVLDDVQGSKAEPVYFALRREGILSANWDDRGVGHELEYELPAHACEIPALPDRWAENAPGLATALRDAYETCDLHSKRYALGCIQIRGGEGVISATDGRQLLKQTGFNFGFNDEILLSHSRFFTNALLPSDRPVRVGRCTGSWVSFQIGSWTHWLQIVEGRFPNIDRSIPARECGQATMQLAAVDSKFLLDNLPRLPTGDTHRELTVELNGRVVLRACSASSTRPVELILSNSGKQGAGIRVCTDRKFLARAVELGLAEIQFPEALAPAVARDASRTYVWMLLDPKEAVQTRDDAIQLQSPLITRPRQSKSLLPRKPRIDKPVVLDTVAAAQTCNIAVANYALPQQHSSEWQLPAAEILVHAFGELPKEALQLALEVPRQRRRTIA